MNSSPYLWLAIACYAIITVWLFRNSMHKNPHYRKRLWRLERAFLILFCLIWPVSLPIAIFAWNRSAEKRLLDAKKRYGKPRKPH